MKKLLVFMLAASFCATCAAESRTCYEWKTAIDEHGREYQYADFVCKRPGGKIEIESRQGIDDLNLVLKEVSEDRIVLYDRNSMRTITIDKLGTTVW